MMQQQWAKLSTKVDSMSKRERVLIFATVAILALSLVNALLLEPLSARQKGLRGQISQQQQKMDEIQSQIAVVLQENAPNSIAPQRIQINRIKQELAEGNEYLKSSREKLVQPEKMAEHLRQLLNRNSRLQLVALQTLPVTPLIELSEIKSVDQDKALLAAVSADAQLFKHGVKLTLRGNYLELLQYLKSLERLPQQMYWAKAQMNVAQYPATELTLILYTLSLDKTWLQV